MLKFIKLLLVILLCGIVWSAETTTANIETDLELKPAAVPSPAITSLSFEKVTITDPAVVYEYFIEDKYAPGETVTFNLNLVSPSAVIQQVTLLIFNQKLEVKQFSSETWVAHYQIPKYLTPGGYFIKLYVKGRPSINAYEKIPLNIDYRMTTVNIVGGTSPNIREVREALSIQPGEFYNETKAEVNRQKILDLGYFEKTGYQKTISGNQVVLTYLLKENPVIQEIDIRGSTEFSKKELMENFSLKAGEILSYKKLQKDVVSLEKFYRDKDYLYSRVASVERPVSANGNKLIYYVNEGHIRSIYVTGNTVTKEYVITREMEMKNGDIFSAAILREDLRRIYNLNYFQTVEPELNFDENTNQVDITINLKEKKTSSINFGGGYGQLQGWFGFVDLFLDNIAGTAQSVLLKAQFGQNITSYQMKYHNPWMWDNKTSFTGKIWSTYGNNFLTWERELRNGWSAAIGFQRSVYLSETYSFKYEDVFNTDDKSKNYLDRAVGYSIAYDSRDQWMNPTRGNYDVFSMDHSSSFFGGTVDASRYMIQFNRFYQVADKQVLAGRFMYNYAIGQIFATDQYYVGSDNTVRGYRYVFAKGLQRAIFNFEYRYIFNDMFTGLLFYDIGQAINPVYDETDDENGFVNHHGWGSSMGFGFRIITPMGPIRLDYGWPQHYEISDGFLSFNMGQVF